MRNATQERGNLLRSKRVHASEGIATMATAPGQERLAYVLRRKEFFNQKSFDIFEKLQIGVFAYVAYVFGILGSFAKKEWTLVQANKLIGIADVYLALLAAIFVLFMLINVI